MADESEVEKLYRDPTAAVVFLAAFIRSEYGWDEKADPRLPSTGTDGPLDIARSVAHHWVGKR